MANDFTAIGSALYSALGGTAATPAVYYAFAPQGSTPPYVVVQRQSAIDERNWTSHFVSADYVIKAVSDRQWPAEAWQAYGSAHATIDEKHLTVSGYTAMRCERIATVEYIDPERFWHVGGIYRIEIQE